MKKQYILVVLLLAFKIAGAQDTLQFNRIIFKVAPFSFLDKMSFPTTQAGFELRLSRSYSIDFSYGQVFGKDFNNHSGTGFKTKFEVRKYTRHKQKTYVALEGFYNKIDHSASGMFENSEDSTTYQDDYFIKKIVWGINVKCGLETKLSKRFVFDCYFGIGIRVKDVEHFDRIRPEDSFYQVDVLPVYVRDHPGSYSTPNLTAGAKIGYIIK